MADDLELNGETLLAALVALRGLQTEDELRNNVAAEVMVVEKEFSDADFATLVAERISELINSSSRSPTKEQLVDAVLLALDDVSPKAPEVLIGVELDRPPELMQLLAEIAANVDVSLQSGYPGFIFPGNNRSEWEKSHEDTMMRADHWLRRDKERVAVAIQERERRILKATGDATE